jgi:hypothetical protein
MKTVQHQEETLCHAYMCALSARAGVNIHFNSGHDYGVDGYLQPIKIDHNGKPRAGEFSLEFQLKGTINWALDAAGTGIVYDLDAQAYNDIVSRDPRAMACVLIVLCLPREPSDWLEANYDYLRLRHCCYWMRLSGDLTANTSTIRITIPRANLLTAASVRQLLADERIRLVGAEP